MLAKPTTRSPIRPGAWLGMRWLWMAGVWDRGRARRAGGPVSGRKVRRALRMAGQAVDLDAGKAAPLAPDRRRSDVTLQPGQPRLAASASAAAKPAASRKPSMLGMLAVKVLPKSGVPAGNAGPPGLNVFANHRSGLNYTREYTMLVARCGRCQRCKR